MAMNHFSENLEGCYAHFIDRKSAIVHFCKRNWEDYYCYAHFNQNGDVGCARALAPGRAPAHAPHPIMARGTGGGRDVGRRASEVQVVTVFLKPKP